MPKRGVRYRLQLEKVPERKTPLPIDEAIERLRQMAEVRADRTYRNGKKRKPFDQTVELVMHLGIDPTHADQMMRGAVTLPHGIGKTKRVIAFCEGEDVEKALAAGAIEAGADELVQKVADGWTDFDVAIAHPRLMSKVGKLGRILGPQGKMPSPKSGTVTPDVAKAVAEYAAGKLEYRNDKGGNIHAVVGKLSFPTEKLRENIEYFIDHIRRSRPAAARGQFIRRVCLSATQTPSVTLSVGG